MTCRRGWRRRRYRSAGAAIGQRCRWRCREHRWRWRWRVRNERRHGPRCECIEGCPWDNCQACCSLGAHCGVFCALCSSFCLQWIDAYGWCPRDRLTCCFSRRFLGAHCGIYRAVCSRLCDLCSSLCALCSSLCAQSRLRARSLASAIAAIVIVSSSLASAIAAIVIVSSSGSAHGSEASVLRCLSKTCLSKTCYGKLVFGIA